MVCHITAPHSIVKPYLPGGTIYEVVQTSYGKHILSQVSSSSDFMERVFAILDNLLHQHRNINFSSALSMTQILSNDTIDWFLSLPDAVQQELFEVIWSRRAKQQQESESQYIKTQQELFEIRKEQKR